MAQVVSVIAEKQYSTLLTSLGVVAALAAAALAFDLWRRRRTLPRPDTEKLLGILIHVCVALSTLSAVALVSVLLLATRPPEPDELVSHSE